MDQMQRQFCGLRQGGLGPQQWYPCCQGQTRSDHSAPVEFHSAISACQLSGR